MELRNLQRTEFFYVVFLFLCFVSGVRADNNAAQVAIPILIIIVFIALCCSLCKRLCRSATPKHTILIHPRVVEQNQNIQEPYVPQLPPPPPMAPPMPPPYPATFYQQHPYQQQPYAPMDFPGSNPAYAYPHDAPPPYSEVQHSGR